MTSPTTCLDLRAKRSYGDVVSSVEPPWESGLLASDCYWCLKTLESWGPDGQPALPDRCSQDRSCHSENGKKLPLA